MSDSPESESESPGKLDIVQVWAIPVEPDILGAHLQAYKKHRCSVKVFQLCYDSGQIQGAPVGKLPLELVDMIVDWVMVQDRQDNIRVWARERACCDNNCRITGHGYLSHESIIDLWRDHLSHTGRQYNEKDFAIEDNQHEVNELLKTTSTQEFQAKHSRQSEAGQRRYFGKNHEGSLASYNTMMIKEFGLEIITFHDLVGIHLPLYELVDPSYEEDVIRRRGTGSKWDWTCALYNTVAFLTIPAIKFSFDDINCRPELRYLDVCKISGSQKRNFAIAMRMLNIKPYTAIPKIPTNIKSKAHVQSISEALWRLRDGALNPEQEEEQSDSKCSLFMNLTQAKWPQLTINSSRPMPLPRNTQQSCLLKLSFFKHGLKAKTIDFGFTGGKMGAENPVAVRQRNTYFQEDHDGISVSLLYPYLLILRIIGSLARSFCLTFY
ncbi:uncharacterized protein K452DRAFT_361768 [Aplosporella prunicola CBS 121167]|uniref:Uncharacterized protein n=1 Tax=Aplosporella prunicola CBS 121167 TaxID=1176127 RepID=A0A6A6B0P1_9PEZI|nr:uncharacterized protein K452DRAFT_361768 [Aplosporella prunicola CBS 121167]KAF2137600.1 hypothetical protein K452DRAFT_361768 [Aplosporella prunicola CBS 121167]